MPQHIDLNIKRGSTVFPKHRAFCSELAVQIVDQLHISGSGSGIWMGLCHLYVGLGHVASFAEVKPQIPADSRQIMRIAFNRSDHVVGGDVQDFHVAGEGPVAERGDQGCNLRE